MCEEEKALDVLLYAELDRVIVENGTVKGLRYSVKDIGCLSERTWLLMVPATVM